MKIQVRGDTLEISELKELGAANANLFRDDARKALTSAQRNIDIDLSQTRFVDSCGLGALIALHKTACDRKGRLRLMNPTAAVQQILELTRLHRILEIVKS